MSIAHSAGQPIGMIAPSFLRSGQLSSSLSSWSMVTRNGILFPSSSITLDSTLWCRSLVCGLETFYPNMAGINTLSRYICSKQFSCRYERQLLLKQSNFSGQPIEAQSTEPTPLDNRSRGSLYVSVVNISAGPYRIVYPRTSRWNGSAGLSSAIQTPLLWTTNRSVEPMPSSEITDYHNIGCHRRKKSHLGGTLGVCMSLSPMFF